MRKIKLSQGKYAAIDDSDFEYLSRFKWFVQESGETWYAIRRIPARERGKRVISMHRELLNPPNGFQVDHKNRNGLDNRRNNLRLATRSQNRLNRGKQSNNTSGYKGVCIYKDKWRAQITNPKGKVESIGYFTSPVDAARAYDMKALEYFGEFAWLNFPTGRPMH